MKHGSEHRVGADKVASDRDPVLYRKIRRTLTRQLDKAASGLDWLYASMHPYFFITMKEECDAIVNLSARLDDIIMHRKVTLLDQDKKLIIACRDIPGSVYDTLKVIGEREISYAEMIHSYAVLPDTNTRLEIQRFEFDRKSHAEIAHATVVGHSRGLRKGVRDAMSRLYPDYDFRELDHDLDLITRNNAEYVRISPAERIARILWLYQQGRRHDGLYLGVETKEDVRNQWESRLLFSVGNPPQRGFLAQIGEVFQRLGIGVRRSYSLFISTGIHYYFLGTFYVTSHTGELIDKDSNLVQILKTELYNTQILAPASPAYTSFVTGRVMTGEEASLTNALIAFCYTTLGHNQPDRFARETVMNALHSNPDIVLKLIATFKTKFDPAGLRSLSAGEEVFNEASDAINTYNTGHRYLDEIRKTIFGTCLLFIRYTLKTNFFVSEKHALAFRLDPRYLAELGPDFTADLPAGEPFRITFFFGRYGLGYHIGFSDIARGGWRTIICRTMDDYITNAVTLFREVYVLAHTQHLKNKDIYEGGSKMTVVLNAEELASSDEITQRLYKLQYGFINAFFDIFVTDGGRASHPQVVDYYGEDEPIELGPDENMHDAMIEFIARQSVKKEYLLGIAVMSSKRIGINHKEYGVTSRGVMKFAEVAMQEVGIDIRHEPFTVKMTGGTNGDVAGNCMRLLLERCQKVKIRSIAAGSGGLFDPEGIDRTALERLLLRQDIIDFDPRALHPGGFLLFRRERVQDGLRTLFKKLVMDVSGVQEQWITSDEFHREFDNLIFAVPADLFLPCGGRPESIDGTNWKRLFARDGSPTARVIAEGANSYITPQAREAIQRRGVIVIRDASANKCGVISSSYEVIANLLMTDREFLIHKNEYVANVLEILDRRAEDEAVLIFKRYRDEDGRRLYTEISNSLSTEINEHYANLFTFFTANPALTDDPVFRGVVLQHLPAFIRKTRTYSRRVRALPQKITSAILASEIATSIVYHGGWDVDFEKRLKEYVRRHFMPSR